MPRKSRKSRAKSEQQAKKKLGTTLERHETGLTNKVFGNFHQGDERFSPLSRAKQCPCNSLAMLCSIEHVESTLNSSHIDEMLIHGDALYKTTASKLETCFELANDGILTNDQLPTNFALAERKKQQACEAYQKPEIAERKKQQARVHSHEAYQNPDIAAKKKQQASEAYQKPEIAERKKQQAHEGYQNPEKGRRKRTQARERSKDAYSDPQKKVSKIQENQLRRSRKTSDIDTVVSRFKSFCKEGMQLIFVCQICQRINFRHQVKILKKENYNQRILLKSLPPDMSIEDINVVEDRDDSKTWVCNTCHASMKAKRMPTIATVNGLNIQEQPPELSHLNMLERHLIAPAIPFMKMISLIKGAQKGVHGQIVCVKADVNSVAQSLPRLPTDHSLIRVKLKRKLEYKGHHMCQDVNPSKIRSALVWLKENNPEYEDIDINFEAFDNMLDDQLIHSDHSDDNEDDIPDSGDECTQGDSDTSPNVMNVNHIQDNDDVAYVHDFDNDLNDESVNHADDNSMNVDNVTDECRDDISLRHSHDGNEDDHSDNEDQTRDDNVVDRDNIPSNEVNENEHDVTNTSAPLYSFLHAVDFAQYAADKSDSTILSVAPGQGNKPEHILEMEPKCFPVEFPDGSNTYNESREQKLSPSRYFNARLFSADNRFARNPEYIFFALYCTEVHQIHSNVSIATRIGCTKTSDGKNITASMLRDHEQVKQLIKRDEGYRFLAQLRGTPAYWEKSKKDIFAMIRQLGIPTFFVTFSAADRRWIEIHNSILKMLGKPPMTPEEHKNMSWDEHCDIIMSNPVAAAKLFQERLHTFINDVIMSPANPIGKVKDYFYRTEFQQRGWPHIHMVAWVENAPQMGEDPDNEVLEFVDRYISCEIPPETDPELHEIVTSVQVHSKTHTRSCRKTGKTCRFNFPKPPSDRTFICTPTAERDENDEEHQNTLDRETKAKNMLNNIWELLQNPDHDFADFYDVLCLAGIGQDEFEQALETLSKRQTMYLKRRLEDQWINNYNPDLIRCWNGNMDIQYVLDPYACVMYIVSYITKSEREMGDLLRNAQKEAAQGNNDAIQQLRKLGSIYLQNREVSVMGAVYLICSMPLRNSTRKVMFLQTALDGQRISLPLTQLQANAGNSEQVWQTTQIEKYLDRPSTPKYNNMCMATFYSTHYQVSAKSDNINRDPDDNVDDETDDDEASDRRDKLIQLNTHGIKMKERKGKPAVIRYPRVSKKKDSERYHMNMLRLYLPHKSPNIKPDSFPTYESYHMTGYTTINNDRLRVKDVVEQNMSEFEPKTDELDEAWEVLQEVENMEDAWAGIAPQSEQQRIDDRLKDVRIEDSDDDLAEIEVPELQPGNRPGQRDAGLPRCAIETQDVDQKGGRVIKVHETPHDTSRRKDDTSLVPYLKLAVGARTMLIANIDVPDGLCNGVSGTIKGIEFGNSKNMPQAVYVRFDSDKIGRKARSSQVIPPEYVSCVAIMPRKETFQLKGRNFSTTREQMPLKLAWAVTVHKVQGLTTEQAVISMKCFKESMAYVALSRVTTLEGMHLTNCDFFPDLLQSRCSTICCRDAYL
ncbi:uncharacterized protein [Amphiura filiformis]|uniref:uncharacterized protein n=1 Tax=Amphiura filiformis TaxID=82378 RepID=UPI003B219DA8